MTIKMKVLLNLLIGVKVVIMVVMVPGVIAINVYLFVQTGNPQYAAAAVFMAAVFAAIATMNLWIND